MEKIFWLLAAPALIGAGSPVDADTRKDLRCFVATSTLATSSDPKIAMAAVISAQYFLGRIDGRTPALDLERALMAEAAGFTAADLPPLLMSCGKQVQERGETMKSIGERMQEQGARSSSSSS